MQHALLYYMRTLKWGICTIIEWKHSVQVRFSHALFRADLEWNWICLLHPTPSTEELVMSFYRLSGTILHSLKAKKKIHGREKGGIEGYFSCLQDLFIPHVIPFTLWVSVCVRVAEGTNSPGLLLELLWQQERHPCLWCPLVLQVSQGPSEARTGGGGPRRMVMNTLWRMWERELVLGLKENIHLLETMDALLGACERESNTKGPRDTSRIQN